MGREWESCEVEPIKLEDLKIKGLFSFDSIFEFSYYFIFEFLKFGRNTFKLS